ncbi:hypothetical protein EXH44_01610 [Actinobacillus indolicus]|uniref:Outer membrane protein P1 n=1 Tax=Actinobacillus indolicus TaxID=51049 RepID=A0A4P7CIB4_9PAST|nr:outer membrane protein transport protein [Actinobacillus indolicus]QBQ63017.1 hypothetical protein EXH44_01610 [Actinobacillus indolicus]
MTKFTKTIIASLFTVTAAGASAAAFQLAEVSTSGLGMAYAGNAAVADNASVVATNPALMTKFKNTEISAGGVFIDTDVNVSGTVGSSRSGSYIAVADATARNIIPTAIVPNLYIVSPINDRFAIGGGINVNYGLKSEYNPTYNGGFFGGKTDLTATNFNFSGAYDVGYGFSVGAGLNAVYSKAEVVRYLGVGNKMLSALTAGTPYAALGTMLGNMPNDTVVSRLKGDELSFGWNVGISYDINENNRLGVAYHSPVNVKFKGQYSNGFPTAFNTYLANPAIAALAPISVATGGQTIPGNLTLRLPAYWEISGYHKLTDKFAVQYSYKRTEWSKFKSLDAYGNDGKRLFHKQENFNDSSRIALGVSYDVIPALTLRAGVAYDESASVTNPSISIPDTDRTWYTLGATYRFTPNLSSDLGYAYLRGSKNTFNEEGRGQFTVTSKAHLVGLNVNYKF